MATDWKTQKNSYKINNWLDFKIILQKQLLGDPRTKLNFLTKFVKNIAASVFMLGLMFPYICIVKLQMTSPPKLFDQF